MNKLLDAYNLRSRLSPALLVLLPLFFGLLAWVPGIKSATEPLMAGAISAGVVFLLVAVSRDAGNAAQSKLVEEWGGYLPSVLFLRHRDSKIEGPTKSRYHAKIQALVDGLLLPSAGEEAADPQSADEKYQSACRFLLGATRDDKKFSVLKEQNMNYGFRRNLFGLRPYGIFFSAVATLACLLRIYFTYRAGQPFAPWPWFCLATSLVCAITYVVVVSKDFVRRGADAYALALLESLEQL